MTRAQKKHPYYNYDRLYSRDATWNFLCGGRGLGKTYGAKKKVIQKFLRSGEQFIYLRRYKSELRAVSTFFADLAGEKAFADWDFRTNGMLFEVAPASTRADKKRPWRVMGYGVALSTSQSQKGIAFPLVTTIIFDEFIIEKGAIHYLPDEFTVMMNFYSTVDRYQDKTKVLFLANAVSITNPYFLSLNVIPQEGQEFMSLRENFVLCHFPDSAAFSSSIYQTRFGRFIKDTEYADYAVGNEFKDNNDSLLSSKSSKARYYFTLETSARTFSVWYDMFTQEYFIQRKLPKDQKIYTLDPMRMTEDKTLMTFTDKPLTYLRASFNAGKVMFDEAPTRNAFTEIFKR